MHETASGPTPSSETALPATALAAPLPPPSPLGRTPGRTGQSIRRCLAIPRYLIRHPARSLAIAALLALIGAGAGMAGLHLWASYHLRAARAALERYHTREAVPHVRAVLTIRARDPEALLLAARAARRAGALDEADRYLDQYQDVRGPEDESLLLERVLVRVERGELDSVSNFCRARIERDDPATPLILEALSRGYLRMYRPREAERSLEEWLQRQPDNPQALLIQGQVYNLETRHHDSIASFRRALTVDPEMDDARLRLCEALMQLGLTEEAQPHLEYLRRRLPDNLMVQVHLARIQDRMGHTEQAEELVDAVLARQPRFPPALFERGKLALRAGRAEEAEKWLRQAVALEPSDFQAHYQLSLCLQRNGKPDEAQKEQTHLQQIEEDIKRIQAISTVQMQQRPHDPELHYQTGMIALRAGSVEEGLRWLHNALKENPNHAPSHKALMEHYQNIGDFRRAREHRDKAGIDSTGKVN